MKKLYIQLFSTLVQFKLTTASLIKTYHFLTRSAKLMGSSTLIEKISL